MTEPMQFVLPKSAIDQLEKCVPTNGAIGWRERNAARALEILDALPPQAIVRADHELRWILRLYGGPRPTRKLWCISIPSGPSAHSLLERVPDLGYLFLFHADGRLREAGLDSLTRGLRSAFFVTAIALRLNDWAAPVRAAAVRCAARVFPNTDPDIIARAAVFLLSQRNEWGRWSKEDASPLDQALQQAIVVRRVADALLGTSTGRPGRLLRAALRLSAFDPLLPELALGAAHPEVRKVALQTMIYRRFRWPSHREKQWVDKSMGRYRDGWAYASRAVHSAMPPEEALLLAARDRSAAVRKMAVIALLTEGRKLSGFDAAADILRNDKNTMLRDRAAYTSTM